MYPYFFNGTRGIGDKGYREENITKVRDKKNHALRLLFLDGAWCCNSIGSEGIRLFR
jgi:hypothetical protein